MANSFGAQLGTLSSGFVQRSSSPEREGEGRQEEQNSERGTQGAPRRNPPRTELAIRVSRMYMVPLAVISTLLGAALIVNTIRTRRTAFAAADGLDRGKDPAEYESSSLLNEAAGDLESSTFEPWTHTSPFNTFCPYAIRTEDEARKRGADASILGNTVRVGNFGFGRTGNRFMELSNALRLGYCCKSKLVTLPPKEVRISPDVFNRGNPGPRWFDFTGAPDVAGFNPRTCPLSMSWGGRDAFYLSGVDEKDHAGYTPGLKQCIQDTPRLLGCEGTYFFPVDINVCDEDELGYHSTRGPPDISPESALKVNETNEEFRFEDGETEVGGHNLVVHIRSGDIFSGTSVHPKYGQPPLQFYVRLIDDYEWSRVDFVTNGVEDEKHMINPVITALESRVSDGELLGDIVFHKDRSFGEDLVSMLCADNLAAAVSTVSALTSYHTTARRVFSPKSCATDLFAHGVQQDRADIKVYGVLFQEEEYGPYDRWHNTVEQVTQMMEVDVAGFEQCVGSSDERE